LVGRRREPLEETAAGLRGGMVHVADVTNEAAVVGLYEMVGPFDHLVCTATHTAAGRVVDLEPPAVERAVAAKLWAAFYLLKHGLPRIAPNGSVTLFSGIRGARPAPGSAITSMVNGGLEAFARAMALEAGPVRVNVISPGIVDSGPFWGRLDEPRRTQLFAEYAAKVPARRVGAVEDVASAALFAIANPFLTGAVLNLDGGGVLV
jgi:NAD(P)-dependent dehydrogenase (short-subunit alcohol dehydrogenase family)